jgi:hypothetical protein
VDYRETIELLKGILGQHVDLVFWADASIQKPIAKVGGNFADAGSEESIAIQRISIERVLEEQGISRDVIAEIEESVAAHSDAEVGADSGADLQPHPGMFMIASGERVVGTLYLDEGNFSSAHITRYGLTITLGDAIVTFLGVRGET